MDRILTISGLAVFAGVCAFLAQGAIWDPFSEDRIALEQRLVAVPSETRAEERVIWPWAEWEKSITTNAKTWNALVPEPPPVVAPPPPPAECDPIENMLQGVVPTRRGMGDKVRIITPQNPRGDYYIVGDAINGCTIDAITKTEVTFSYFCTSRRETKTKTFTRE